jgi:molecular chaperone GrpE (heat shock protein)
MRTHWKRGGMPPVEDLPVDGQRYRYVCDRCREPFDTKQGLGGHRASHSGKKGCSWLEKQELAEAAAAEGSDDTPVTDAPDDLTVDDILGATQTGEAAAEDAVLADLESTLLNDLKRLQAEYANYRRRTEEQREVELERARGTVAKGLLPVLDDLDRADKHGDLEDGTPFAAIAEKLRAVAERMGLTTYGAAGEVFDPQQHEAIYQALYIQGRGALQRELTGLRPSPTSLEFSRWRCRGSGRAG